MTLGITDAEGALAVLATATAAHEAGSFERAVELLEPLLAFEQQLHGTLAVRGNPVRLVLALLATAFQGLARYESMLAATTELVAAPDAGAMEHTLHAIALQHCGHAEAALSACERAIVLDPTDAAAHYERACLLANGAPDEAIASARRAIELGCRAADLAADEDLVALRGDLRFRQLTGATL